MQKRSLIIKVELYRGEKLEREFIYDMFNTEKAKKAQRTIKWALMNGLVVQYGKLKEMEEC